MFKNLDIDLPIIYDSQNLNLIKNKNYKFPNFVFINKYLDFDIT